MLFQTCPLVCHICTHANEVSGIKVLKCKEGMNNRAFLLTMDNGSVVFAKLPNSGAGPAFYTTASEVATRTFVGSLLVVFTDLCPLRLKLL